VSWLDKLAPARKGLPTSQSSMAFMGSPHTQYTAQRSGDIGETYADIHFVYEIVHDIAVAGSSLPLKVYSIDGQGERQENFGHPAYQLLRKPNPVHDQTLFFEILFSSRLVWGEWFIVKVGADKGRPISRTNPPVELWPLRPERMTEVPDPDSGLLLGWLLSIGGGDKVPLLASDVIHNRSYHPKSDYRGFAPVEALRYQIELGRDAEGVAIDLYQNGLFTRGVMTSDKIVPKDRMERLAKDFRDLLLGPGNRWKIPFLDAGMDFKALQLNPQDAEWLETVRLPRSRVAAAYGFPLAESFQNVRPEEIRRAKYAGAVQPLTVAAEQSFESHLFSDFAQPAFPEFQLSHILDADFPSLVSALKDAVLAGIMSPNAAGRKLNQPPVNGGDERVLPLNMETLSALIAVGEGPRPLRDSSGGMGGDQGRTGSHTGEQAALPPVDAKSLAELRSRRLAKLSEALSRRLRGLLKREREHLGSQSPEKLTAALIASTLDAGQPEAAKLIRQFLNQALDAAADDSENDIDVSTLSVEAGQRSEEAAKRLVNERGSDLAGLLSEGKLPRDLSAAYSTFGDKADALALLEVAWAYDQGAIQNGEQVLSKSGTEETDMDTKLLLAAIASKSGPDLHVHMPEVTLQPEVKVQLPEQPTPEVNVNVEAPQVTVQPPEVVVNVPEDRKRKRKVIRNKAGFVESIEDE
jgi:HK97 family phage portal protein